MGNFKNRTGEINLNNNGSIMKIVDYRNSDDIDVLFIEQGYIAKNKQYSHFKKGNVRSPYDKTAFGVGYLGIGKYHTTNMKKGSEKDNTKVYEIWYNVMRRCYSKRERDKFSSYENVSVCEEWHNFQNFAKWYEDNCYEIDGERMHLDKDILFKGNKVYSPEYCIIVPIRINSLFVKNDIIRGELPVGVKRTKNNRFAASLSKLDKIIRIGTFDTSEEAFEAYKQAKEQYIKEVADEYKDKIPKKLYNAMYRWEVEITD